jgi:hypothetical protein
MVVLVAWREGEVGKDATGLKLAAKVNQQAAAARQGSAAR